MFRRLTILVSLALFVLSACGCGGGDGTLQPTAHGQEGGSASDSSSSGMALPVDPLNNTIVYPRPADDAAELKDIGSRKKGVDWPCFLGPTGDSRSSETGILTMWPDAGPRVVWQRDLNTGYDIGTVSKGRYFHFERIGDRAAVLCLNAETGEKLWDFDYPTTYEDLYGYNNGPRCSVVVDGNRAYAFGAEGMLHCLRASDGEPIWKVDTAKEFGVIQNFFGVGSTPVVSGDKLIVMVGGSPAEDRRIPPGALDRVSGNGSGIVAFDKLTGAVKYKLSDELASYASLKLATIDGRQWCFAFARGGLLGFEPDTGKQRFHYPWRAPDLESVNAAVPVVFGKQVFVSETYGPGSTLLTVKPDGYDIVWRDDERKRERAMQTHWNTCVYLNGCLYGSSGRHTENAELRCIDAQTGEVKWTVPETTRCSLLYVDGHFVVQGEYGHLWLIKATPEKHEIVARIKATDPTTAVLGTIGSLRGLRYPCWAAPVLSHGLLYVRGEDKLLCLELIAE
jgi:outer membrane protein assembly factor BamB